MSFRHLKIAIAVPCLAAAVAASTTSSLVGQSNSIRSEMPHKSGAESQIAFRGSGRFEHQNLLAYRASGRLQASVDRYNAPYRGSERGIEAVAYRASGRFSSALSNNRLSSEALEQNSQAVAYRASGRFANGLGQDVVSYRGSERGIEFRA